MTDLQDELNNGPDEPVTRPRFFRIRFRLWFLFLLFIPVAFYGRYLGRGYHLQYTESKSDFQELGLREIEFDKFPNGTPTAKRQNVDNAYQAYGVSFSFGTPDWLEEKKEIGEAPAAKTTIHVVPSEPVSKKASVQSQGSASAGPESGSIETGARVSGSFFADSKPGVDSESQSSQNQPTPLQAGFVGISGYRFKFPETAVYLQSVAPFENSGPYVKRFVGPITIRFHRSNQPDQPIGVYRVGFFAARLNTPETLEVRLYSPSGRFIARQTNLSADVCVFMGFSCNREIGWLEIEGVGADRDYAITGLTFDEIK